MCPPELPPLSNRHALVVDDHSDSASALKMMLETLGWRTETAEDGIGALKKAVSLRPELIFLDISMPKLDGFDTCGVIRAQPWAGSTRMIAVTGLPQEDVSQRVNAVGFDGFLLKPVEYTELAKIARIDLKDDNPSPTGASPKVAKNG